MIRNNKNFSKDLHLKITVKKTSNHISVLPNQNGDLVGHTSFQKRKLFATLEKS